MDFSHLVISTRKLGSKHAKLWNYFTELHADWKAITPGGKNKDFGEVEVSDLDANLQSFTIGFLGISIQVKYIFSPWLEEETERGSATVRYSLVDRSRPGDKPMSVGQFMYRTDGIATVDGYTPDQLDFDEPTTAFVLLGVVLRACAHAER